MEQCFLITTERRNGFCFNEISGEIYLKDLKRIIDDLSKTIISKILIHGYIFDIRNVNLNIALEEYDFLLKKFNGNIKDRKKIALLIQTPLQAVFANLLKELSIKLKSSIKIEIFSTMDAAEYWLEKFTT